jgi:hypothetical protein
MFYKVLGWVAIVFSILALAPSVVPGGMSVLALYIVIPSLIVSIITIESGSVFYFKSTAIISAIGIFIVNDGLRLYGSLAKSPLIYKLSVYSIFIIICLLASFYAKKHPSVIKSIG